MHVTLQLKVPVDLAVKLRSKLEDLQSLHAKEVAFFQRRRNAATTPAQAEKLMVEQAALRERSRRLTFPNLVRVALENGIPTLKDADKTLAAMAEEGLPIGRPRRAAGK